MCERLYRKWDFTIQPLLNSEKNHRTETMIILFVDVFNSLSASALVLQFQD